MTQEELKEVLALHRKWFYGDEGGKRADLQGANLLGADLQGVDLQHADLQGADLQDANLLGVDLLGADLRHANLQGANLQGANLQDADLWGANLRGADLQNAKLQYAGLQNANLQGVDLQHANLQDANLQRADLRHADLQDANLRDADLRYANLQDIKGLVKIMGVAAGNIYWKRFNEGLKNNDYQFYIGINTLFSGEVFADDERVLCSYPGFHFGSRSWCAVNYSTRPLEAKIKIPLDAKINEPWATDGKASADKIEILQVFDTKTGEDVTEKYKLTNLN